MSNQPQSEHQNNHKQICRICLKDENLISLNEKYENENIIEMLQTCFSIQVKEDDDLPKKICLTCVTELVQAYKLSKKFQTSKTILNEQKPKPVALIKTIDPDTNDDEFVLPDKSIDRKDIEIGDRKEFILIDKNIIRKIKDHNGQQEIPSPSEELKLAKLKIINAKSNVVEEVITTPVINYKINRNPNTTLISSGSILKQTLLSKGKVTPGRNLETDEKNVKVTPEKKLQIDEKNIKETPGRKINILSIKPFNKDLNSIRGDENKNITNLQLNSVLINKKINTNKNETEQNKKINEIEINSEKESTNVKSKDTNSGKSNKNHKWNTRNKIYKTRRNNKLKKKKKGKDFSYSSARYHEQFEKFLTGAVIASDEGNIQEIEENIELNTKEEIIEPQQSTSSNNNNNNNNNNSKTKEKLGYKLRFANKKECPICKKSFKYLESHIRIHSNKKFANKKLTNKKSPNKSNEEIEIVEKLFSCKICDRKFYQKNMLLNHERIHQNVKKYPCSLCEKSFNKMTSLEQHFNMHTKKNLYECDICKKRSYNIKSNLYRHQRVCSLKTNGKRHHREV